MDANSIHTVILIAIGLYMSYLHLKLDLMATPEEEKTYLSTLRWIVRKGMSDPKAERVRKKLVATLIIMAVYGSYFIWFIK